MYVKPLTALWRMQMYGDRGTQAWMIPENFCPSVVLERADTCDMQRGI